MQNTIDSARVLLKKSWEFYKLHWKKLISFNLVMYGGIIVLFALYLLIEFLLGKIGIESTNNAVICIRAVINFFAGAALTGIVYFSFSKFVYDLDEQKNPKVLTTIRSSFPKIGLIISTVVLMYGLTYGGFFVFIIPGIFFSSGILFYMFVSGVEGKMGLEALLQSYWYTNNKKLTVFFRGLCVSILMGLIVIAVPVIGLILLGFLTVLSVPKSIIAICGFIFAVVFVLACIFIIAPVASLPVYFLYKNIKSLTTETIDPVFYVQKKKKFKIFIGIGFAVIIVFLFAKPFILQKEKEYLSDQTVYKEDTSFNPNYSIK